MIKKLMSLHIASMADIGIAVGLFLSMNVTEEFAGLLWVQSAGTVFLAVMYIKAMRLDVLEALKPVCGALILLFFVCPIPVLVPNGWPYHPAVWARGTLGLTSLIIIALALIYLIKAKGANRRKAGMGCCLAAGLLLCMWCVTTTV